MKISQKAEYAVRAVVDIALNAPSNGGVRAAEIARRTGLPEKFLKTILLDLRKGGIVASKRGPDGGHWLARDPSRVTVGGILELIDGPLISEPKRTRKNTTPTEVGLNELWRKADRAVRHVVDSVTVEDLRALANTPGASDFNI